MGEQARREAKREAAGAAGVMSPHEAKWLAWYMCALSFAFTALGLVLVALSRAHYPGVPVFGLWVEDAVVALSFSAVGALVAPPLPPPHPLVWVLGAAVAAGSVAAALSPGPIGGLWAVYTPRGVEGAPSLSDPVEALMFALLIGAACSLLARLRRAGGVERQQIKWFAYAACVLAVGDNLLYVGSDWLGAWWLPQQVGFAATVVGLAGLPVALGVAVLRYRLHDIDLIVGTTLVYGILT